MTLNKATFRSYLDHGITGGAAHPKVEQEVINLTGFLYNIHCNHEILNMSVPDYSPYLNCSCRRRFSNDWLEHKDLFFRRLWSNFDGATKQRLLRENLAQLYLFCFGFDEKDILSQLPTMDAQEKEKFQQLCSKYDFIEKN